MFVISQIIAIVAGVLAASNLIVSRLPDAGAVINKLRPYQGIVGIVLLVFGILNIVDGNTGTTAAIILVASQVIVGLLLGWGLISKHTGVDADAVSKLVPFQGICGIILIVVGVLNLIQ